MQWVFAIAREHGAAAAADRLRLIERCVAVDVAAAFDEYEARLTEDATGETGLVDELTAASVQPRLAG